MKPQLKLEAAGDGSKLWDPFTAADAHSAPTFQTDIKDNIYEDWRETRGFPKLSEYPLKSFLHSELPTKHHTPSFH